MSQDDRDLLKIIFWMVVIWTCIFVIQMFLNYLHSFRTA